MKTKILLLMTVVVASLIGCTTTAPETEQPKKEKIPYLADEYFSIDLPMVGEEDSIHWYKCYVTPDSFVPFIVNEHKLCTAPMWSNTETHKIAVVFAIPKRTSLITAFKDTETYKGMSMDEYQQKTLKKYFNDEENRELEFDVYAYYISSEYLVVENGEHKECENAVATVFEYNDSDWIPVGTKKTNGESLSIAISVANTLSKQNYKARM
ncbi:MAG: hypothetical protein MJZ28_02425 [Paludibacteraceae bacterium]|nr:hypothetical protein [Paludibacteraceae bacterium]